MHYFIGSSCDDKVGSGTILKWSQDEVASIIRPVYDPNMKMFPSYTLTDKNGEEWYLGDLMVLEPSLDTIEGVDISETIDLNTLL